MEVFHLATLADWQEAQRTGAYTTSTRGVTLAEEGFVHASRAEQLPATYAAYYADVAEPLVVLSIETDLLEAAGVAWRHDPVGDDTFPHVYGAVPPSAVTSAEPLELSRARWPRP